MVATPTIRPPLRLPCLKRIKLNRFSLYSANPDAELFWNEGVLCIIGANGLGKSTLLSAVNFAFTGIVPEANRDFKSMEEYYTVSRRYFPDYFKGRIIERDRLDAEITIEFALANHRYTIRRGLFDSEELRTLEIVDNTTGKEIFDFTKCTRREKQIEYEQRIVEHIGLTTFPEFVFLQLFVLTFDERRVTLFWNSRILERALYLAFGLEPETAKEVDDLKREHESVDSQVRNRQFDATRTQKRINEIQAQSNRSSTQTATLYDLTERQEHLLSRSEELLKTQTTLRAQLRDTNLRLATLSAKESSLRDEYNRIFTAGLESNIPVAQHPLLKQTFSQHECGLCGNQGETAINNVRSKIESLICPLCESTITKSTDPAHDLAHLQALDINISETRSQIKDSLKEISRIDPLETEISAQYELISNEFTKFQNENESLMLNLRRSVAQNNGSEAILHSYYEQYERFLSEKREAESKRAAIKKKLNSRQADLQRQYFEVESRFVPLFTDLAYHFLGMPLDIKMTSTDTGEVGLFVEVRGSARREIHQLSESQRFFLDIAFRMALATFISSPESGATLTIDTPEGSLDIAYEKRAGEMLAKFVRAGNKIIMTANLNSSRLLIELAKNCNTSEMVLCRMTDWAELSEVQQEEHQLFTEAYQVIEQHLKA